MELNKKQKEAYKILLNVLQELGTEYVYTQGQNIEWFTVKEIEEAPFYEIKYIYESYITVKFHTHENGYQQFVLKLHDEVCKEKIITEETNSYFFEKEYALSTFIMKCLNEMYGIKNGDIFGHLSVNDDGTPLATFKKSFMVGTPKVEKKKTMQECKDDWFKENAPFGKELGYPECCIKEFCEQPPELLKGNPTQDDLIRYETACVNGTFTGFIPCKEHAKQIVDGKITLQSLIQNRNKDFKPFPNY